MMKNSLGRETPEGRTPFSSSDAYKSFVRKQNPTGVHGQQVEFFSSYEEAFNRFGLTCGMTFSFHHHLRNGDFVVNEVTKEIRKRGLKDIGIAPSSIFPGYTELVPAIEDGTITRIHTNYLNGPVSDVIQSGKLSGELVMQTHGGRARSIESGELAIDIAFLATPTVDRKGNGCGGLGKSACGVLGYAISDLHYAKKVVLVTDNLVDSIDHIQFSKEFVDAVIVVDRIGDPAGIVSGTTRITRDPIGLKIAKETANLLYSLGIIRNGFSMQTGAGGTSLAVVDYVRTLMKEKNIRGRFASGGITSIYVQMLEEGLFDHLYDVQCFDLEAVRSSEENKNHVAISASKYGNPFEDNPVCDQLDFVILGATEIDTEFNVNVTTDSFGKIIGGSGGHSDIAHGAKCTVVVSQLIKSRLPIIKEEVQTISTPGSDIDIFVCERGIAINPKRTDLIERLDKMGIQHFTMRELLDFAHSVTGIPRQLPRSSRRIGYVEYRDGTVIDSLYGSLIHE